MLKMPKPVRRLWRDLRVVAVLSSAIAAACSSSSQRSVDSKDAGADASTGGNAGTGGSGGASGGAGAGGVGGSGGTSGADASTGGTSGADAATGGVAGTDAATGGTGGLDASTDAASDAVATGGTGGSVDAGACPNGVQGGDGTVSHPRWPIPQSNARATSEFTLTTDTALDHATCLMWQRNLDATLRDWDAAKKYCDDLGVGSHTDWRLPTRAELISLTDFTTQTPAINGVVFPGTNAGGNGTIFWASTVTAWDAQKRWVVVHGGIGQPTYFPTTNTGRVRCVRGAGAPSGARFDTSVAGTVKDNETGLFWEAAPPDVDTSPVQAKTHCDGLSTGGFNDWRVPSLRELQLLIDPTIHTPSLPAAFTTKLGGWYWSNTFVVGTTTAFWAVQFNSGFSHPEQGSTVYNNPRIRCVR